MKAAQLAALLIAHHKAIDGVMPNSEDARPPDGDDWNQLDAILQEVIQKLDDVSASAETMLLSFGPQMSLHDFGPRTRLVQEARDFCDAYLRPEDEEDSE